MDQMIKVSLLAVAVIVAATSKDAAAAHDFATEFEADCNAFVELASSNPYPGLTAPGGLDYDDEYVSNIQRKFAQIPTTAELIGFADGVLYRYIDVDGDGLPDDVAITTGGTANVNQALVIATSAPNAHLRLGGMEDERVGLEIHLSVINGRHFFLTLTHGYDNLSLWTVRNGQFRQACQLSMKAERIRVVKSTAAVCDKVSGNGLDYVTYPATHALTKLPNEGRFWSWYPISGLARIDVDNDGTLDDVTRIRFSSGAGRGCEATYVAVLDKTLGNVPENEVNHQLEEIEGHCGPDMKLFTYEGRTYLESIYSDGSRTVGFFNETRYQQVCEFEAVRTYEWTH
jgi:hypothetical protein